MNTKWIVIDIETADAPESAILEALAAWRPPGNCTKQDTIETKRQEAETRYREKAALMDASPIICIAVTTSDGKQILFSGMPANGIRVEGWHVIEAPDERFMLIGLRQWLDHLAEPDATLVGHNIRSFDLPKLRQAYIRHGMRIPEMIRIRMDDETPLRTVDTMSIIRSFSMELRDEKFVSLDQVARVLGIERPKQLVSGADVPGLYRQGCHHEIATYAAIDATVTMRAFLLMTGQAAELQ